MRHMHGDGVAATTLVNDPVTLLNDPTTLVDDPSTLVDDPTLDDPPNAADNPDPFETGNKNPLIWSDPHHITIGLAPPGTTAGGVTVSDTLNTQEITLLKAATQIWSSLADVQFQFVDSSTTVPDIRVGLAN